MPAGPGREPAMYAIPLVLLIVLGIAAVAWSPLFAVVVAGILFVVFLAYARLRPRLSGKPEPPP